MFLYKYEAMGKDCTEYSCCYAILKYGCTPNTTQAGQADKAEQIACLLRNKQTEHTEVVDKEGAKIVAQLDSLRIKLETDKAELARQQAYDS